MKLSTGKYYGRSLKQKEFSGLILTETDYSPYKHIPTHSHENPYFCLLLQGSYMQKARGKQRDNLPSSLVFHTSEENHSDQFSSLGGRCFNLEIQPKFLEQLEEYNLTFDRINKSYLAEISGLMFKLYKEFAFPDKLTPLAIEAIVLEMMVVVARHFPDNKDQPPVWLKEAIQYMKDEFSSQLTIGEIARSVKVNPAKLTRVFRKYQNCSVGEYLRRLRLAFACRQLASDNQSVAEIALSAGFYDQSHFTKAFKKTTGLTPKNYREHLHNN